MKYLSIKNILFTSIFFLSFQSFAKDVSRIPLEQFIIPEKRDFKLSETIQPCDNFYEYVCSEEIKKFQLPEEYPSYSFYTDESNLKYKKLINEFIKNKILSTNLNSNDDNRSKNLKSMIKHFYESYLNSNARRSESEEIIRNFTFQTANMSKEQLLEHLGKSYLNGEDFLMKVGTYPHPAFKELLIKSMNLPLFDISYPNSHITNLFEVTNFVNDLENFYIEYIKILGFENYEIIAKNIIHFYKYTAIGEDVYSNNQMNFDNPYFKSFENNIRNYNLYFKGQTENKINKKYDNQRLYRTNILLNNASLEDIKALSLIIRISPNMEYSHPDLYEKFSNIILNYYNAFSEVKLNKSRSNNLEQTAYSAIYEHFEQNINYLFIQENKHLFNKKVTQFIFDVAKKGTIKNIKENSWMSQETKDKAMLKIRNIKLQNTFPEKLEQWQLERIDLLSPYLYLKNLSILKKNKISSMLENMKKIDDESIWRNSLFKDSIEFKIFSNQLSLLPSGLYIHEFNKFQTLQYMMGSVGSIIAHEIAHYIEFKEQKEHFISFTNEREKEIYEKNINKMINLYNKYGGDGKTNLRENIADYIGLNSAYKIVFSGKYKSLIPFQKEFFVNYAKLYCEVSLPSYNEKRAKNETHSSPEFRVNNILRLLKDFEDTYACKHGDPMTLPENERVSFW